MPLHLAIAFRPTSAFHRENSEENNLFQAFETTSPAFQQSNILLPLVGCTRYPEEEAISGTQNTGELRPGTLMTSQKVINAPRGGAQIND